MNTLPHACFQRIHALHAGTHSCLCSAALFFSSDKLALCFSFVISDRKATGQRCSIVPLKIPWCAFHFVQRYKHFHLPLLSIAHKGHHIHFLLERKDVHIACARASLGRKWSIWLQCWKALSTGYEPNAGLDNSGTFFCRLQTAMMKT